LRLDLAEPGKELIIIYKHDGQKPVLSRKIGPGNPLGRNAVVKPEISGEIREYTMAEISPVPLGSIYNDRSISDPISALRRRMMKLLGVGFVF
jgi:hypothetical protein